MVYCTLFDSNFLDRGLVLIKSLFRVDNKARLYVLCMDDLCYEVLSQENMEQLLLIKLSEFEDERLLSIKKKRSRGEYCWTCTAMEIKYVLTKFHEEMCTYIDADMKFYANPDILIQEMKDQGCVVQVVPHRFAPDKKMKQRELMSGKYCVQFNTFTNDMRSMKLLDSWVEKCMNDCSMENGGDQKYIDTWSDISFVNKTSNIGAGVAPWNVNRYKLVDQNQLIIQDRFDSQKGQIIFYHFQNLVFPKEGIARVSPYLEHWIFDRRLVRDIYRDYLNDLYQNNQYLKQKYGVDCYICKYITEEKKKNYSLIYKIKKWLKEPLPTKRDSLNYYILCRIRRKKSEFAFFEKN